MIEFSTLKVNSRQSVLLLGISMMLTGCLGGTVAQQIARSIATSVADSAVATAMDVDEQQQQDRFAMRKPVAAKKTASAPTISNQNQVSTILSGQSLSIPKDENQNTIQQNLALQQSALQNLAQSGAARQNLSAQKNIPAKVDPYKMAFINSRFEQLSPDEVKAIEEPLPTTVAEIDTPVAVVQSSQLVPVELFNLLIGEEKTAVYNKAKLMGASSLPKQQEWKLWRVATGAIKIDANRGQKNPKIITFLIPPDFGKFPSGSTALVEIASPGELNIARYKMN